MSQPPAKRCVLVVGGGAAGTAAAWSLSRSPRFAVSLWESAATLGGVATTERITLPDGSVVAINDGVQGGAPSYRNTLGFHASALSFAPQQVFMKVAFGKAGLTWSNVGAPSDLVRRMQPDIARFGRVLRRVDALPFVFAFVPIRRVLRLWRFDPDFGERLVYPLTALFFGTGNRTPEVSAAIIARVFLDPKLRLFDYSPERLLASSPEMFAFQQLGDIYAKAAEVLRAAGVDVRLNCACSRVERFPGAANAVVATDATGAVHKFDAIIFACDAATALRLLERPGFWERHVLSSVRYYDDVTYTHSDEAYMREHYELHTDTPDEQPDYYIWSHPGDASKLEMSFDLGHYQPHLRSRPPGAPPIYQVRGDLSVAAGIRVI
jgi:predicted NAD/FAD-binding protein